MRIEYRTPGVYTPYIDWLKVEAESAPPVVDGPHLLNDVMTAETYIGDQFIEIVTDNVHQGAGRRRPGRRHDQPLPPGQP